jgi:hypothetical protein
MPRLSLPLSLPLSLSLSPGDDQGLGSAKTPRSAVLGCARPCPVQIPLTLCAKGFTTRVDMGPGIGLGWVEAGVGVGVGEGVGWGVRFRTCHNAMVVG